MKKNYKLGLVGVRLDYSYSKDIHESFNNCTYDLIEIENEEKATEFFKNLSYDGVNVTNPYKKVAYNCCDVLDISAKRCECVNTIVNKDGKLYGYNTDYFGFEYLLKVNNIDVKGKNCYVLGTGGSGYTVREVLLYQGAKTINMVSRTPDSGQVAYSELLNRTDIDLLINATPVGVYPNLVDIRREVLILLNEQPNIKVIDLNYNPHRTLHMLLVEEAYGGIDMLIAQAIKSQQYFTNINFDIDKEFKRIKQNYNSFPNIAIIGMMGSGKTTYGKKLAKELGYDFVDTDEEIVKRTNMTVEEIMLKYDERFFRELEEQVVLDCAILKHCVIATGGGVVLNSKIMLALKTNSHILFLDKKLEDIIHNILHDDIVRPLIHGEHDIIDTYNNRIDLYRNYADEIRKCENDEESFN